MFSSQNAVSWFFGLCFAASVGWFGLSLERLRKELNSALSSGQRVTIYPPLPKSVGQLFTNSVVHVLQLLDQHHQYYPTSSLSKALGLAIVALLISFAGYVLTTQ